MKEIIIQKDSIFNKIKKFFLKFLKKDNIQEKENVNNDVFVETNKTNFSKDLKYIKDEEEVKILKLQEKYKQGNILEENMTNEEHNKLIELYKKQNYELREKIKVKQKNIRKRLNELKT